jgi:signal transduction histidine kinase
VNTGTSAGTSADGGANTRPESGPAAGAAARPTTQPSMPRLATRGGSIANRVFVMILGGIILATVVTTWLAASDRKQAIEEIRDMHTAERVEQLVLALEKVDAMLRPVILQAAASFGVDAKFVDASREPALIEQANRAELNNLPLQALLKTRLGGSRHIGTQREPGCTPRSTDLIDFTPKRFDDCQTIYVSLRDGELLRLKLHSSLNSRGAPRLSRGIGLYAPPYLGLFLVLIALLAYMVARMTARPIGQLAQAAGELGADIDRPPLPVTGPTEIRRAAAAFNAMQARIRRQIQHRTHMLAAITHDLQTPLTRLRLRLEKVGDAALRDKLIDDLAGMQVMVREGLDLARSMDSSEPMQLLDIDSLLDSACADAADAGQAVTYEGRTRLSINAQPRALRRCLTNLLDNAVKYGKHAKVLLAQENDHVVIRIRDGGAGIPADRLDAVFDPFFRLETSRSRDTGGTGLGLTIARNIAENHGGSLTLVNHPGGGLEAILRLPVKSAGEKKPA